MYTCKDNLTPLLYSGKIKKLKKKKKTLERGHRDTPSEGEVQTQEGEGRQLLRGAVVPGQRPASHGRKHQQ